MTASDPPDSESGPRRSASAVAPGFGPGFGPWIALGIGVAAVLANVWIQLSEPTSALVWPLVVPLVATAIAGLAARLRGHGPSAVGIAVALVACAVLGTVGEEVPRFASATDAGDSPAAAWVYLAAGVGLAWFLAANPLRLADAELVVLALVVFSAGNGKVWTRDNAEFFPIYGALAALALVAATRAPRVLSGVARVLGPLALAFTGWVLVCGVLGEDRGRTDEVLGRLLSGVVAGWAAARALDRAGVERALVAAALCGLAAWAAVPVMLDAARVLDLGTVLAGTRLRLFGLHPNLTGTFLAVELVLAVGMLAGARGWRRLGLAVVVLGCAPGLFQTKSRTAWLAALVGLATLALARRVSRRAWFGLAAVGVAGFVLVLLVPPLREAALRPASSGSSLSQRIFLWDTSARLVAENPIAGIGVNNYFAHERAARSPSFFDNTDKTLHPHNLLLAVAEGAGLVGLALFLGILACTVILAVRAVPLDAVAGAHEARAGPAARSRPGAVLLAATTTLVLANMFDLGLSQVTFVPTLLWLLAGFGVALSVDAPREIEARVPSGRVALAIVFLLVFAVRPFVGQRYFEEGVRHESSSDPTRALVAWERAGTFLPFATGPVVRAARVATTSGQRKLARDYYERAIALSPTAPRFHYRYALFLSDSGRAEEAAEACRRALELSPHSPEEALFRTLFAENLARAGRAAEAREELGRALLAMSRVPERFETTGWTLPVTGGEPIDIAALASSLALDVVADARQREDWEVRRRGDRIGRILRQLGRPEEALAMLARLESALGHADPSLRRLEGILLQDLGRLTPEGVAAHVGAGRDDDSIDKSLVGFIEQEGPRAVIAKCESDLRVPLDVFFNVEVFRPLFRDLLAATLEVDDDDRARGALEGVLYFSDDLERVEALAEHAETLLRKKRRDEVFPVIRRALLASELLEHPPSRVQSAFALSNTALAAARGSSPTEMLAAIERATGASDVGASGLLFQTLCHLGLAPRDPSLEADARVLFERLRSRYPDEGEQIARYFEQVDG